LYNGTCREREAKLDIPSNSLAVNTTLLGYARADTVAALSQQVGSFDFSLSLISTYPF
jgi:hypothetical protein